MRKKKKFQGNNKIKISNTLRMTLIFISVAVIAISSSNLIKSLTNKDAVTTSNKKLYKYENRFSSNSKINLKRNDFVNENEMLEGQAYLSDLISDIDMNLNYKYTASKKSKVTYNYKIEAIVKATYTNTKNSYDVLNKTEVLKEESDKTVDSNELSIDEDININYQKYNQIIKDFKQSMSITTDSNLLIRLTVNTNANVNSKEVANTYVSNYKITVGDKIAVVEEKNHDETSDAIEDVSITNEELTINYKYVTVDIIIVICLIIIRFILRKTEELKFIRNEFKLELNRIMKSYEDKIVEIQDLDHIDIENATKVKDITQLRKLAEEALVPMYCYIKDDKDEQVAYFIVTKYENSYIYILK